MENIFGLKMEGKLHTAKIREYCDYLDEHLDNVAKAFAEVSEACNGMAWVGDDYTWHTFRREVELHDLSKFSKEEFIPYQNAFFNVDDNRHELDEEAWKHHKDNNDHHWEYIYNMDRDKVSYGDRKLMIIHMVVDWTAMSYKFGGTAQEYYESNSDNILVANEDVEILYTIFNNLHIYSKKSIRKKSLKERLVALWK